MRVNPLAGLMIAVAGGTLACADGTAPEARRPLSVSFITSSGTAPSASAAGSRTPARASLDVAGSDAFVISRAQLVMARMELVRAGATCASDDAAGDDDDHADDDDCAELELAPSVIDLPVNGTVVDALTVSVPAGTYSSLEAKVRPVRSNSGHGHGSAAFLAAHPDLEGVSVLVQGTFNGEPFTFTSDVSTGAEQAFDPPLEVGTTPLNLTVHVDLATWFASSSGGLIDPRSAGVGTANGRIIADNIKRSFRAFGDDDRDGHDDHGEHGGEGGHH